jgi:hypothetical protein
MRPVYLKTNDTRMSGAEREIRFLKRRSQTPEPDLHGPGGGTGVFYDTDPQTGGFLLAHADQYVELQGSDYVEITGGDVVIRGREDLAPDDATGSVTVRADHTIYLRPGDGPVVVTAGGFDLFRIDADGSLHGLTGASLTFDL